jgi:hypothetical protein
MGFSMCKEATGISPRVFITDSDPAVGGAVVTQFPDTFHIHCIWHIGQNLPKQLKGKLGSNFDDLMKDFYRARNSLTEKQFNERYVVYCVIELSFLVITIVLVICHFLIRLCHFFC